MPEQLPSTRWWLWGVASVVMLVLGGVLWDHGQAWGARRNAGRISVGMTKEEVRKIMGSPAADFDRGAGFAEKMSGMIFTPGHWAYGTHFSWGDLFHGQPPFVQIPIQFRFFGALDEDVVIWFDGEGRVADVRIPGK